MLANGGVYYVEGLDDAAFKKMCTKKMGNVQHVVQFTGSKKVVKCIRIMIVSCDIVIILPM